MKKFGVIIAAAALLSACGAMPAYHNYSAPMPQTVRAPISTPAAPRAFTPIPDRGARGQYLPDRVSYSQKDPRWGKDRLGNSKGNLALEGCVVTSVAMALGNLGIDMDPGELNRRLRETGNFTPRGWLIWNGVSEVTGGRAKAHFYDTVSEPLIQSCLTRGDYPLVRFYLPNGRSHWAMILGRDANGYHMRDPLRTSDVPLIFPRDASAFKALRCIGRG